MSFLSAFTIILQTAMKRLASLLPPMDDQDALESAAVLSLAGQFDIARWGLGKDEHPVKISSTGGYFGPPASQETPDTITNYNILNMGTYPDLTSSNTITGNAGDGLAVHLHAFTVTTDVVANSNTVSTNAGQGMLLDILNTNMNDVVASFNTVQGNTGGPGMSVLLNNTTGGPIVADQIVMNVNSISNNAGDGLDVHLNNISNVTEVTVRNTQSTGNAGAGYVLSTSGSDINTVTVANGNFSNNTGGDGLQFNLATTSIQTLAVDSDGINTNSGNGLNLNLDASAVQNLLITNNSQGSGVNIGLTFLESGNTFPFGGGQGAWSITNSSDPGVDITSFHFDTTPAGKIYNTVTGGSFPFTPYNGTDTLTGLQTVDGTAVPPYPNNVVPDYSSVLDLTFNNFNSGETFSWDVDMDDTPGQDSSVFGNDLIGSQVAVTFSGGLFLSGTMQPVAGTFDDLP